MLREVALSEAKSASWMSLWAAVRLVTALVNVEMLLSRVSGLEGAELTAKRGHAVQRRCTIWPAFVGSVGQGRILARTEFVQAAHRAAHRTGIDVLDADVGLLGADHVRAELEQGAAALTVKSTVAGGRDVCRTRRGPLVLTETCCPAGGRVPLTVAAMSVPLSSVAAVRRRAERAARSFADDLLPKRMACRAVVGGIERECGAVASVAVTPVASVAMVDGRNHLVGRGSRVESEESGFPRPAHLEFKDACSRPGRCLRPSGAGTGPATGRGNGRGRDVRVSVPSVKSAVPLLAVAVILAPGSLLMAAAMSRPRSCRRRRPH